MTAGAADVIFEFHNLQLLAKPSAFFIFLCNRRRNHSDDF
jgi:hypothetical protein